MKNTTKTTQPTAKAGDQFCPASMTTRELLREIHRVGANPTARELVLAQRLELALSQLHDFKE